MASSKRYRPQETELRLQARWRLSDIYKFERLAEGPVYAIDTPPATVSGKLHMGHVYSYSHADFMARFWRMNGRRVFYPMGYDDNGLPTERLVENQLRATASQIGRQAFIKQCLRLGETIERDYETLWRRLGLSVDWSYTYRTIEDGTPASCPGVVYRPVPKKPGLSPGSARHLVPGMRNRNRTGRTERN